MLRKIKIRLLILGICTMLAQITIVPYISVRMCEPDLCCAITVLILMRYPMIHAVSLAFFVGMIKDVFSTHLFGIDILSLVIPACFFPYLIRKADTDHSVVKALIVLLFSLVSCSVYTMSLAFTRQTSMSGGVLVGQIIGTALYTVVIAAYLDMVIAWFIPRKTMQYELF